MRTLNILALTILVSTFSTQAFSDSCWKIRNKDSRAYCESKNEGKHYCWKIREDDKRYMCEVEAYGRKTCWKIQDNDTKALCKSISEN
jgi:hypothetical protein